MKIKDLFYVHYGINLELNNCELVDKHYKNGVNFVARTSENNGVVGKVKLIFDKKPQLSGTITCAGGGSVLSTFLQMEPYYSGRDLYILTPKNEMSINEKLFWCMCIKNNAYRYSYGRQANKTLKDIELPDEIPEWVNNTKILPISTNNTNANYSFNTTTWEEFKISDFFDVMRGERIVKNIDYKTFKTTEYKYPVITSSKKNNGVDGYYLENNCKGNTLVCGGEASGLFTTYQANECWVMDRARIFTPNINMNVYIALFFVTIMNKNQYKYSYGRSANPDDIKNLTLKLPVKIDKQPNWIYIENYIKSLAYADKI